MNDIINSLIASGSPLILLLLAGIADRLHWRWLIFIAVGLLGLSEVIIGYIGFALATSLAGGRPVIAVDSFVPLVAGLSTLALLMPRWRFWVKRRILAQPGNDTLIDLVALIYLAQGVLASVLPALVQQLPSSAIIPTESLPTNNLATLLITSASYGLAAILVINAHFSRTLTQMRERLGWAKLHIDDITWGLGGALVAFFVSLGVASIGSSLDPAGTAVAREYTGQISMAAGSAIGLAIAVVVAGIMEETLFRGAIQPRLGLVRTAALFAILHAGYGLFSFAALSLFMIAILFGLLRRRRGNTLAPALAHAGYNLIIVLVMTL